MTDCLFCEIAAGNSPAHVVAATDEAVAFLDHRPVFKGHTLVIPRAHVVTLPELGDDLLVPVFSLARSVASAAVEALGAAGSWVSMNNTVSQAVAHLHIHVVPRRFRDGLRGFYWPREGYESEEEAARYAGLLSSALEG